MLEMYLFLDREGAYICSTLLSLQSLKTKFFSKAKLKFYQI
jgi:hypothetical protein